ncbi:MAG: dienelactone hydrolase family protein [Oligoflexus sp.]|nr:dienelactone hydrolase family protein [Oligoflexus sp.]
MKVTRLSSRIAFLKMLTMASLATLSLGLNRPAWGAVRELTVKPGDGLSMETLVIYPAEKTTQPLAVVLVDHGFLMNEHHYKGILTQIADQGFVVVAPQAYPSGGLPFGKPTTLVEAQNVAAAFVWLSTHLSQLIESSIDFRNVALLNHSRGSKVAFNMLNNGFVSAKAFVAIDPVDGTKDGSPRVTDTEAKIVIPSLIIGTGLGSKKTLGQACAPEDVNYNHFWDSVQSSPSWLFVAEDYGHMDLLDSPNNCGFICRVCSSSKAEHPRDAYRTWIASTVGNFLKAILYHDAASLNLLNSSDGSGLNLSEKSK